MGASACLAVLLLPLVQDAAAPRQPPVSPEFVAQMRAAGERYQPIAEANEELLLEGDMEAATKRLLEAVPASKRTAADAFLLGNLLFSMDFEESSRLHGEAFKKARDNPVVQQEWALEQHRSGRHAEALSLYEGLVEADLDPGLNARLHALRADCLLHLDRAREACEAWEAADVSRYHTEVEQALAWIYTPVSPETRRCDLIRKARAGRGDAQALSELIRLDLHWDRDLWNTGVKPDYARHDLALAAKLLGGTDERYQVLSFLVRWTPADEDALDLEALLAGRAGAEDDADFAEAASSLGAVGEGARLPADGYAMLSVFGLVLDRGAASAEELLESHEPELRRRSESEAGDIDALRVLAGLYERAEHEGLAELEELGWKKYRDVGCVLGLLSRREDELRPDDPLLMEALDAFPDDERVRRFAVSVSMRSPDVPVVEPLTRWLMAALKVMAESHRANDGFTKLAMALEDEAAR